MPVTIELLFRQRYTQLCRLAALIVGDRDLAEQVVMQAFTDTFAARGRLNDPDRVEAYLRRAVVNEARTLLRRRAGEWRVNAVAHARARSELVVSAESRWELEPVARAVQALPDRQRVTVLLRYYADLSEAQIADALGCSVGTVKSNLFKARGSLARALPATEEGHHDER